MDVCVRTCVCMCVCVGGINVDNYDADFSAMNQNWLIEQLTGNL